MRPPIDMTPIARFREEFFFLSNFFPCKIVLDRTYPSAEHAYVAYKISDPAIREFVSKIKKAADAKRYGRGLTLDPKFVSKRKPIMRSIVTAKFTQNPELLIFLRDTQFRPLIEGNDHGDRYWGQSPLGEGENNLGKILMEIRDSPFI